jgi:hypothetical protein
VALAHRFVKHSDTTVKDLQGPANDPRRDVRQALGNSLFILCQTHASQTSQLANTWLRHPASRIRYTALVFLPGLAPTLGPQVLHLVTYLDEDSDRDVQAALAAAINAIARGGMGNHALELLASWSDKSHPNTWVICRILSASWVSQYPSEVESILRTIQPKTGVSSEFTNALKALKRHGLEIEL